MSVSKQFWSCFYELGRSYWNNKCRYNKMFHKPLEKNSWNNVNSLACVLELGTRTLHFILCIVLPLTLFLQELTYVGIIKIGRACLTLLIRDLYQVGIRLDSIKSTTIIYAWASNRNIIKGIGYQTGDCSLLIAETPAIRLALRSAVCMENSRLIE